MYGAHPQPESNHLLRREFIEQRFLQGVGLGAERADDTDGVMSQSTEALHLADDRRRLGGVHSAAISGAVDVQHPDRIQRLCPGVLGHESQPFAVEVAVGERDDVWHRPKMLVEPRHVRRRRSGIEEAVATNVEQLPGVADEFVL